jgi:dihydroorotate dehydrogenase (fumarate)
MDLATQYLGLHLAHPFMAGASPMSATLDGVRRLEDAGAAAIVLPSLFEEQITLAEHGVVHHMDPYEPEFAAALAQFPPARAYASDPDGYLEQLRHAKQAVRVPVLASLNGMTPEMWLRFATKIQEAGADALELNMYALAADPQRSSPTIEKDLESVVTELHRNLRIPLAVKLLPFFTALGHLAARLDGAGANGLVLFNRYYEPDIDTKTLTMTPRIEVSTSAELPLRLMWIAMLRRRVRASLAAAGGVETADDAVKAMLAGADVVQVVSTILRHGRAQFGILRDGLTHWMESKNLSSVQEFRGRLSLDAKVNLDQWQRAQYIRTLQSWMLPS